MKLVFWFGLGDEVAVTGLVRELRRRWPQERIAIEGNRYPELFLHNPNLGGGMTDNGQEIRLVPGANYNVGNFVRAYAQFCGLRTVASSEPELYLTEDEVASTCEPLFLPYPGTVAIDTWAFWPRKRWGMERFVALTKALQARAVRVVEIGSTQPDVRGTRRTRRLPIDPEDCLLDLHSVRETAAVLSQCHAYIGNDSGLAHLAAAVGTPAIVLCTVPWYGIAYRTTYPVQSLQHDCLGCAKTCVMPPEKSCLGSITVEDVLAVFDTVKR